MLLISSPKVTGPLRVLFAESAERRARAPQPPLCAGCHGAGPHLCPCFLPSLYLNLPLALCPRPAAQINLGRIMFILTIHLSMSVCWVNGQIYCLTRWALSSQAPSLPHPPMLPPPDTDLGPAGLRRAASQDRLWEQGRRAGVSPLQPTIAAALQVAELPPTAEAGAAHRPGADAGRVRSKAHKDWGPGRGRAQAHRAPARDGEAGGSGPRNQL